MHPILGHRPQCTHRATRFAGEGEEGRYNTAGISSTTQPVTTLACLPQQEDALDSNQLREVEKPAYPLGQRVSQRGLAGLVDKQVSL